MKTNLLFCLLHLSIFLSSFTSAWATDYDSLVSQARDQLQNEQYSEALTTAKEAVSKNPNGYHGHYYAAMAYMSLGQFNEAEAEVETALNQAPQGAKTAIEKLVSTIKVGRQSADKASVKDIFLECRGTLIEFGEDKGPVKEMFKISGNSWYIDGYSANHCLAPNYRCVFDNSQFALYYEDDTNSKSHRIINRKTGKYIYAFGDIKRNRISTKHDIRWDDGVCVSRPDPESRPNKF